MKKYIKHTLLLFTAIIAGYNLAQAQQEPMYSQYMFNLLPINPAYTGIKNLTNFSVNTRFQWLQLEGSPVTNHISGNTSIFDGRAGIGFILSQDRIGVESIGQYHLSYGYNIQSSKGMLSFGLQTGVIRRKVELEDLSLRFFNDPFFDPNQNEASSQFNVGAGIIYKAETWILGLSIPRILKNSLSTLNDGHQFERHLYLTGAYLFTINPGLKLKPMFLYRHVEGAPASLEFNAQAVINNKYWAGFFTDNLKTLGAIFQLELARGYRFGYSFEMLKNPGLQSTFFSHELAISINLALLKEQDVYIQYF